MKKYILSLLFSLPFLMLVSCSADSDSLEPDSALTVDDTIELSGVTLLNDTFYAVAGTPIEIDAMSIKTVSAQTATLVSTIYFLDGNVIASKNRSEVPTVTPAKAGKHTLSIAATLRRADNTMTGMPFNFTIVVVDDASMLPANAPAIGTYSKTIECRK